MKHKFIIVVSLVAILSTSAFATTAFAATTTNQTTATESTSQSEKSGKQGKKEKVAEPENAIGKDKAKAAALKDAGIAEDKVEKIKARVTKLDDGTVVYKVGFTSGDTYYSYKINALTGAVADKSTQSVEEHEASKQARRAKMQEKAGSKNTGERKAPKAHGKNSGTKSSGSTETTTS